MARRPAQAPTDSGESGALLRGTLEVMILRTLEARGPLHGYGIARAIERASGQRLGVEEGSLYPALRRLEKRGDVDAAWKTSETGRRARYYTLSRAGRERARVATEEWAGLSEAVNRVLGIGLGRALASGVAWRPA